MAQMTVVGPLRFIKPNEMAHCSQSGHRPKIKPSPRHDGALTDDTHTTAQPSNLKGPLNVSLFSSGVGNSRISSCLIPFTQTGDTFSSLCSVYSPIKPSGSNNRLQQTLCELKQNLKDKMEAPESSTYWHHSDGALRLEFISKNRSRGTQTDDSLSFRLQTQQTVKNFKLKLSFFFRIKDAGCCLP